MPLYRTSVAVGQRNEPSHTAQRGRRRGGGGSVCIKAATQGQERTNEQAWPSKRVYMYAWMYREAYKNWEIGSVTVVRKQHIRLDEM